MPRQPSARAHEQVLTAAVRLIAERGIDGLSVDAIAQTSGVSKATIYKHWDSKEALCLEAISQLQSPLPEIQSNDIRQSLVEFLRHLAEDPRPRVLLRIMPKVFGHASRNPAFLKAWAARIEEPRRTRLEQLIRQAMEAGELRADVDLNFALHLLLGPVFYHRMMHTSLPQQMPERIVETFWKTYAPDGT